MLALLFWQLPDFDPSELVPEWTAATPVWLALAIVLTFGSIVLSAVRWQQVLHALELKGPLRHLVSYYFAGQFVSNALPTTIGGDVVRVARLSRENGEAPGTFASVVLERLTGWIVLPLITFVGFLVNPGLRELGAATAVALTIAAATLVALVAVVVAVGNDRLFGRFADREGWRRFAGAVHLGIDRLRRHPSAAVNVLLAGLAYQLVLVLAALMASEALGMTGDVGFTALLAFLPAVLIAQVMPIGISGLGIREGAFVLFLHPLGVPNEQAIALGLILYLLNFVASLAGAPSFAVGGPKRARAEAAAA
jgi:uncharacterized membrane protein YbhN (UPF0104 family)